MNHPHQWAATSLLLLTLATPAAHAGTMRVYGYGGAFTVAAKSLQEQRWETVVKQQYDFSCGSAAVATLLTFHYDRAVPEAEVFRAMFNYADQQLIQVEGFSMLDLKNFLDGAGLRSNGFRLTLDEWMNIGIPGIALIETNGYRHFVVVKGILDGDVLLGDLALGLTVLSRVDFERGWNGVALIAQADTELARRRYNAKRDWKTWSKAPLASAVNRTPLGLFALSLPRHNEFGK